MALVDLSADNFPKERYLHTFVSKQTHVECGRVVVLISHPMRTVKVSLEHPQFEGIGIHLFQEVLDVSVGELPAAHVLIVVAYICIFLTLEILLIVEILAEVLRQNNR